MRGLEAFTDYGFILAFITPVLRMSIFGTAAASVEFSLLAIPTLCRLCIVFSFGYDTLLMVLTPEAIGTFLLEEVMIICMTRWDIYAQSQFNLFFVDSLTLGAIDKLVGG